ncbi:MAG: MATE family efflux transporter [Mediterranea sp.]|nr:MATE family efflux transporter [Mediterranea sp.]
MTTAPVRGLIIKLAMPSIVIMLISALYNMADTFFVGFLGTSQVAAVGIAFPLMAVIQAIGFFFGQGSGNFISRALGAQDRDGAYKMAATGFLSGIGLMTILGLAGLMVRGALVELLGATPTIRPYAIDYLLYILLASPFMVGANILNQQLRFQGSAVVAMIGMVSGAVLNLGLDPLFIFAFDMGVSGAAAATMVSQVMSFGVLLAYGSTRKENVPIKFRCFAPSKRRYQEIFRGGIPSLLRQSFMSVATIVTNHLAGNYGDAAIAAITIVNRVSMVATSTMLGFGQGFQPVCGFNYGAHLWQRVREGFWFAMRIAFGGLIILAVLLAIFAPQIIAVFRDDPEVIRIGIIGLRLTCISLPFSAWIVMTNMLTQTIGRAKEASLLAISRQGLFLYPALAALVPTFGLLGIQLATPAADMMSFLLAIPICIKVLRSLRG